MDPEEFQDTAPGRLVPTFDDAMAFVPDPLPDTVPLSPSSIRILASAADAVGRLAGITAREFNPYLIGSPLLHREAIVSSRMEGTVTTPEQLVLLQAERKQPGRKARSDSDTQEVLNYINAMERGLDLLHELPVCLRLIRETHRVLLEGVRGERQKPGQFRNEQNWIRGRLDDSIHNARFVPPPPSELKDALDSFEKYLNREPSDEDDPLLVRLALIHYQFEAIHPFFDGNGRIGRLLIPLLMCSYERLQGPILYVSSYLERHREAYQDLLLHTSQTGDWDPWLRFFLEALRSSAEEATQQATGLLDLRQRYHREFQTSRSSALIIRLIDRLFRAPSITIGEAAEILDVTHQGAANNIHKLEEAGLLREITGKKRYKVYVAPEILAFLYDHEEAEPPEEPASTVQPRVG